MILLHCLCPLCTIVSDTWVDYHYKMKYKYSLDHHKTDESDNMQFHMNIWRHTVHTIVVWPNPKYWLIVYTSNLIMIMRESTHILTVTTREMYKLKTHSLIYCIKDDWKNWLNLRHIFDEIHITSIGYVPCLQISLRNDDNEYNVQTNKCDLPVLMYRSICTHHTLRSDNNSNNDNNNDNKNTMIIMMTNRYPGYMCLYW